MDIHFRPKHACALENVIETENVTTQVELESPTFGFLPNALLFGLLEPDLFYCMLCCEHGETLDLMVRICLAMGSPGIGLRWSPH